MTTPTTKHTNSPARRPFVSIVMPVRNEADYVEQCLNSVQQSDYPVTKMEVLIVDGMSDDGTREIVQQLADGDPRIRIIDNPKRIVPYAMNKGIREARGEIIIRVDGHATVDPEFIGRSVDTLLEHTEAWCVGGPVETINATIVGKAIAAAMRSPVGVGNAMFRLGNYEGYVDTIAFGAYWAWVFDRIGLFDEELVRNQDDELNLRLILAGGKIYMNPRIHSQYYSRTSLRKLASQYYQYGFWRIRTIQKHHQPATMRQIAPFVFVSIWIALITMSVLWPPASWGLIAFATLYGLGLIVGAIDVARRFDYHCGLLAPLIFTLLHFNYGLGSLKGLLWFVLLRRGSPLRPEEHPMSR